MTKLKRERTDLVFLAKTLTFIFKGFNNKEANRKNRGYVQNKWAEPRNIRNHSHISTLLHQIYANFVKACNAH